MKPRTKNDGYDDPLQQMLEVIQAYGLNDPAVLDAMRRVRRHRFIPEAYSTGSSYGNHPNDIGHGQTISQPYIVAYMTSALKLHAGDRVLEIGSGCGYQTAVLAELDTEVYGMELVQDLAEHARTILKTEGYSHAHISTGNGFNGWPDHAPYDAIIAACAPPVIPFQLTTQLKNGGKMILPVGSSSQKLVLITKTDDRLDTEYLIDVRFVPMLE